MRVIVKYSIKGCERMKQKKVLTLLSAAAILTASFYMINKSDLYASNEELKMQGQSYSDKSGLFLSMDKDGNIQYITPESADVVENTKMPEQQQKHITFDVKVESENGEMITVAKEDTMKEAQESAFSIQNNRSTAVMSDSTKLRTRRAVPSEVSVYTKDVLRSTTAPSIVRFKNIGDTTSYTEDGTGIAGYTHASYAADAAYLATSGNKVKFKMAGVTGWVNASNVEIIPYTNSLNISYYKADNGKFYHYISTNVYGSGAASTQMVGYQPNYIKSNTKYYSYDGHYFYTSYAAMIDDYKNNRYSNAVNASQPYYNYYQFLSQRTKTSYSAADINKYIASRTTSKSKIWNKGSAFTDAEKFGANAALMMGLAINESAWGMSSIAQSKNNIFGLNAVDSSPGTSASTFASVEACINDYAKNYVSLGYASPFDWRYYGPHLGDKQSGMNVKYASDPYWGEKAAAQAWQLENINGKKDYQKYQLGIDRGNATASVYKEADSKSKLYYQTGNDAGKVIHQFSYVILDTVKNSQGTWYKIQSDEILKSDRSNVNTDSNGVYDFSKNYAYIKADNDIYLLDKVDAGNGGNDNGNGSETTPPKPEPSYKQGDANLDGKLTPADYVLVKNHIMNKSKLTGTALQAADANKDNKISPADYIWIKNKIMGK